MNDKEKLVEIIANARRAMRSEHIEGSCRLYKDYFFAGYLLSHGVTFANDINVLTNCGAPMKGESK